MPPLLKHNFSTLPVAPQSCRIVTWHDDFLGYLFPYSSSLQLCLLVIQLLYLIMPAWHSIMFDIIFQLLLFVILKIIPGRLVIVCHAISYFMNFIELWLVTIQLFNIDSISTDRLYLSPQKHRWFQDVSDSGGKGENYQRALTLLNEAVDILRSPCTSTDHPQQLPAHRSVGSVQVPATSEKGELGEMALLFPFYSQGASAAKVSSRQPFKAISRPSASSSGLKKSFNQRKPGLTRSSACENQTSW